MENEGCFCNFLHKKAKFVWIIKTTPYAILKGGEFVSLSKKAESYEQEKRKQRHNRRGADLVQHKRAQMGKVVVLYVYLEVQLNNIYWFSTYGADLLMVENFVKHPLTPFVGRGLFVNVIATILSATI